MRLAVAASPSVALPTLEALFVSNHDLVRVFSQPDREAGRGRNLTPTPVSTWARDHGLQVVTPVKANELASYLTDIDCVVTIGYGLLIPEDILALPHHGFINLHFSLLPRWRGAAPVQRAIEARDEVTGVTVFQLDAGMDTGPIYSLHRYALDDDITSDELFQELGELGVEAVEEALSMIEAGIRPRPQKSEGATRAYKLSREEAEIDWRQSAEVVSAKIRAFTTQPGAWTRFRGKKIKVTCGGISQNVLKPGEVAVLDKELFIGTSSSALRIGTVTGEGKAATSAVSWANGARLLPGERCE